MITLARHAMATRFELVLHGDEEGALRTAGEAALDEIDRLDEQLSFFRPTSEVAAVNRWAAEQPIKLEARLVALLQRCQDIWAATGGAFDPTIGPITRLQRPPESAWLSTPRDPAVVRGAVGFEGVVIDPGTGTVRFTKPGMALDLGAVGRGYAIDRAIEILSAHGVRSALLRGGTSSVHVIGTPPDEAAWRVGWDAPAGSHASHRTLSLVDEAVSVSGQQARSDGGTLVPEGHVRDPRTGDLVAHTLAAGVIGPCSLMCDMLSTALLVGGASWLEALSTRFPGYTGWVAEPAVVRLG
jgi:thiamine biosynthesis lipoprotein